MTEESNKTRCTVYTFGAFHYDVAYRRTFEGYLDMSLAIVDAGLDLLGRDRDYVFAIEQVILVREFLNRHPERLSELRQYAREGRLVFAPGMLTMPDVNVPNGESFIRNFLIGRDWLVEHLGIEPTVCWMADIFGHHSQMPQLARLCGYQSYLFTRGKTGGEDTTFWWEGLDGSRILTQWEFDTYAGLGSPLSPYLAARGMAWLTTYLEKMILEPLQSRSAVGQRLLTPIGGDFRSPSAGDIDFIKAYNDLARPFRFVVVAPDKYFEELQSTASESLPTVRADFNPLMQGTYSSRIRIKQANRRLENLAAAIETLEAALSWNGKPLADYSSGLWEVLAWNAFHDIIAGTLEDSAFKETLRDYGHAERKAQASLKDAISKSIFHSQAPNVSGDSSWVALYNSLPYAREELVEIPIRSSGECANEIRLQDAAGRPTEVQFLDPPQDQTASVLDNMGKEVASESPSSNVARDRTVLAQVSLAATAIQSYSVRLSGEGSSAGSSGDLIVREDRLENRYLRVVLGQNGTIVSLFDKENQREWADPDRSSICQTGMNNLMLQPDKGDLWTPYRAPTNGALLYAAPLPDPMAPSGIEWNRRAVVGAGSADADAIWWPTIRVAETGPLRAALEVSYPVPRITSRIYLGRDQKMIRFRTTFIPEGKHYRLRAAFPTSLRGGRIRFSIPCGFVERPEGEYPAQDWIEYSDERGGLCLLNRGLPGNNVTDGVLLLSLFRAVAMEDADKAPWYEEGIEQVFDYALRPFGPAERDYHPARLGGMFNRPVFTARGRSPEPRPALESLMTLEADHAELMALRRVGNELEVRIHESKGQSGSATLHFSQELLQCRVTDAAGRTMAGRRIDISGDARRITLDLKRFEIVTLRITASGKNVHHDSK